MKLKLILIVTILGFLAIYTQPLFSQEMSKDQWQEEMKNYTAKRVDLQAQVGALDKQIADLKANGAKLDADIASCEDALFAMMGVSRAEYEKYLSDLAAMEKRVAELQAMSDAQLIGYKDEINQLDAKAGEMAKSNIALIPRIGDRVKALQAKITALKQSLQREKTYTVGTWASNRDCLWNIAKKKDIYDNAWMWPKIWQGNRDKIKDPDVIKPRWVLKIPEGKELSKEEKRAAGQYYQKKRAAEPSSTGAGN